MPPATPTAGYSFRTPSICTASDGRISTLTFWATTEGITRDVSPTSPCLKERFSSAIPRRGGCNQRRSAPLGGGAGGGKQPAGPAGTDENGDRSPALQGSRGGLTPCEANPAPLRSR